MKSATRGNFVTLQSAATSGNGTAIGVPDSFKHHNIIIKGSAGIASGAIQIETADAGDYSGTWAPIGGGPITVIASTEISYAFEGVYKFLRARISTAIGGGTVTVSYVGS